MDIQQILTYSDTTQKLLYKTLAEHPDAITQPFETISQFRSIQQLIAHLIGAEEHIVTVRIQGLPLEQRYEQRSAETLDALFDDWKQIRANTHHVLDQLDADGLAHVIVISIPQFNFETSLTVEQLLFHLLNHQTYHLGQISMALQQMQIDPPNFDYFLLHDQVL